MGKSTANLVSAGLVVMCLLASWAQAQRSKTGPSGREAYEAARARERNLQTREMVMQHAGEEAVDKQAAERLKALSAKVREDFRRMQVVNNDMMRAVSTEQSLNYQKIGDATGEINKCAKRLKTSLAALEVNEDEKEKRPALLGAAEMKPALFRLDELVMSFVTGLAMVHKEDLGRSARELLEIIDLSDHIRRSAEQFNKPPSKR